MSRKTAVITGVTGQDGAYLAQQLLNRDYHVVGLHRPGSPNDWRLQQLGIAGNTRLQLTEHELTDDNANQQLIRSLQPDEVYNLAAISSLGEANQAPLKTAMINGAAPVSLLEAIRLHKPDTRFLQASSAEIFGSNRTQPQNEETPLAPTNAYAIAKAHAHRMVEFYRQQHGLFACNAVLYNHESPLRGQAFVTRKITQTLAAIANGSATALEIGNLDAKRDWGFAKDYADAMHRMLLADSADTYLLCTGELNSVRHFVELTCQALAIPIKWQGSGTDEIGINPNTGKTLVTVNPEFYRQEPEAMNTGTPDKIKHQLSWQPNTTLETLCQLMVSAEKT